MAGLTNCPDMADSNPAPPLRVWVFSLMITGRDPVHDDYLAGYQERRIVRTSIYTVS